MEGTQAEPQAPPTAEHSQVSPLMEERIHVLAEGESSIKALFFIWLDGGQTSDLSV